MSFGELLGRSDQHQDRRGSGDRRRDEPLGGAWARSWRPVQLQCLALMADLRLAAVGRWSRQAIPTSPPPPTPRPSTSTTATFGQSATCSTRISTTASVRGRPARFLHRTGPHEPDLGASDGHYGHLCRPDTRPSVQISPSTRPAPPSGVSAGAPCGTEFAAVTPRATHLTPPPWSTSNAAAS